MVSKRTKLDDPQAPAQENRSENSFPKARKPYK